MGGKYELIEQALGAAARATGITPGTFPGKKLPSVDALANTADKFVYHSGLAEDIPNMKYGVEPQIGPWIKEVLEGSTDDDGVINEVLENAVPVSWWSKQPDWAVVKVARKLGKPVDEVTPEELAAHGHVAMIPKKDPEAEHLYWVGEEGLNNGPYSDVEDITGKKTKAYNTDLYSGNYGPEGVERNEYITPRSLEPYLHLTGDDLVNFLRKTGNYNKANGGSIRPGYASKGAVVGDAVEAALRLVAGDTAKAAESAVPKAFNIVKRPPFPAEYIEPGSMQYRYEHPETGSYMDIVTRPNGPRSVSVIGLEVPEEHRGTGIGKALQDQVLQDYPSLMGQISSKAAAVNAYKAGRRPIANPNATLEDIFKMIDEDSSVNMATPKAKGGFIRSGYGGGGLIDDALKLVAQYFDENAVRAAAEPVYKSRERFTYISPDQFLQLARPLDNGPDAEKLEALRQSLSSGEKLNQIPFLNFTHEGDIARVTGHEGRHRALALKEAGAEQMPVIMRSDRIRWSEQADPSRFDYVNDWPSTLQSEAGDNTVSFPIERPTKAGGGGLIEDALKLVGKVLSPEEAAPAIRAYHASPHDFDKFEWSPRTFNTGEGAQSYGAGLYFAENPAVSGRGGTYDQQFTRRLKELDRNSGDERMGRLKIGDQPLTSYGVEYDPAFIEAVKSGTEFQYAQDRLNRWHDLSLYEQYPFRDYAVEKTAAWEKLLNDMHAGKSAYYPIKSRIYEVDINARPDQLLDWDAPIKNQSDQIQRAVGNLPVNKPLANYSVVGEPVRLDPYPNAPAALKAKLIALDGGVPHTVDVRTPEGGIVKIKGATPEEALSNAHEYAGKAVNDLMSRTGGDLMKSLERGNYSIPDKTAKLNATGALHNEGIPGLRYLDAGSRDGKVLDPTRNYVIWDDNLIDIKKKYAEGGGVNYDPYAEEHHIHHALRIAKDVGGGTPVFMTDANGTQYDANGQIVQGGAVQSSAMAQPERVGVPQEGKPENYDTAVKPIIDDLTTPMDRPEMSGDSMTGTIQGQEPSLLEAMKIATRVAAEGQPSDERGENSWGRAREEAVRKFVGAPEDGTASAYKGPFTYNPSDTANYVNTLIGFSPIALAEQAHDIPYEGGRTGNYGTAALEGGANLALTAPGMTVLGAAGRAGYNAVRKNPKIAAALAAGVMATDPTEAEAGPARWFSKALEVARDIPMSKMTGEQALAMLRKGTSPEELRWMKVEPFLSGQKQVTKDDLVAYLEKNRFQPKEITLGGSDKPFRREDVVPDADLMERYKPEIESLQAQQNAAEREFRRLRSQNAPFSEQNRVESQEMRLALEIGQLKNKMLDEQIARMGGLGRPTKYHDYATPGGEGYRETLLTMPPTESVLREWPVVGGDGLQHGRYNSKEAAEAAAERIAGGTVLGPVETKIHTGYRSPHWGEQNVLLHTRSQTLESTPPGANRPYKVHNVDETQSDYGQEGRKKGFKTGDPALSEKEHDDFMRINALPANVRTPEENLRLSDYFRRKTDEQYGLPSAPYVTSTEGWTDHAIKRELDRALDNDADYFSWTPGEVHADRYGLDQHLSALQYDPMSETLHAFGKDGSLAMEESVTPDKLADYIGKEAAEKLLATKTDPLNRMHILGGLDLKVGGEGMRKYYDKLYLNRVQEVLRKATGMKVPIEVIEVNTANGPRKQLGIRLTEEIRDKARFSDFNRGGTVVDRALALTRDE